MNTAHISAGISSLILLCTASEVRLASLDDIIYTSEGQLCGASVEVNAESRCIESDIEYESPAWRPGGHSIVAVVEYPDGSRSLALLRPDGTQLARIPDSSDFIRPVWSPDGHHIYAVSSALGSSIGRWDENGRNFRAIPVRGIPIRGTVGPFEDIQTISFSPNGASIAIIAEGFHQMLIAEFEQDSFRVTMRSPEGFASVGSSAWLDDSHLLFVGNRDVRRADLWELEVENGSTQEREIPGLRIRDCLALSPDNRSVVVCGVAEGRSEDAPRWNLWHYTFASSELKKLSNGAEDLSPNWKR